METKIVAMSVPFPGAKRPLEEGAKLGLWDFFLMESQSIKVPNADFYILGAWHPVYEWILKFNVKIGVMWTSSPGEMDFEPVEINYLQRILEDPRIEFVWFGDESLAQIYWEKGFWAPYPIKVEPEPSRPKEEIATLFCPTGPKKNILNQLLAMEIVQGETEVVLHTNVKGYDNILSRIDHVRYEWLPDGEYKDLIASSRVNLACSWCETYNYNVAEAASLGTPSVTSVTVPLTGELVPNPNDPVEIAKKISRVILSSKVRRDRDLVNSTLDSMRRLNALFFKAFKDKFPALVVP